MTKGSKRIRSICEILDRIGPANKFEIHQHIPEIALSNVVDYCVRGTVFGYLASKRAKTRERYSVWTVVPGWREKMATDWPDLPPLDAPEPERVDVDLEMSCVWRGASSVFAMGVGA